MIQCSYQEAVAAMDTIGMAQACAVLPDTFGPGLLGDVIRIPNNYAAVLPYRTSADALRALLPPGLIVAGEPVVSFRFRRAEGLDWSDSTSHFAGATVTVDASCADGTTFRGMYFLIGWEDDAMAVVLGREVAGTVKLPASITLDRYRHGGDRCLVHHRGRPLLEIACRKTADITGDELAGLRATRKDGCTIGYKGLPSADGRTLGEHYLTAIPTAAHIDAAWQVAGEVTLFDTTAQTADWHHRAIAALRSLPLLDALPGTLTTGVNALEIGRARRLT
jgi:Acetoacetate decarboxylase (ADC)